MPSSYLHIGYAPRSVGWLLPVIRELQAAKSPQLRARATKWTRGSYLLELGLAVSTKLAMLPHVIQPINALLQVLDEDVALCSRLDEHIARQAGFEPSDRDRAYKILAGVDAFIYEFRSTYEIVGKLVRAFSKEILGVSLDEEQIKSVLRSSGIEDEWIKDLADYRKQFFHETAPWIALKITSRTPLTTELLILRSNVHELEETPAVIPFSRLRAIHAGMLAAMQVLQSWLISRLHETDLAPEGGGRD